MLYLPMYGISPSRHCCTSWWSSIGLQFQTQLSETGRFLPRHVTREFEDYLACGRLENGFLRVRCQRCSHEHLACTLKGIKAKRLKRMFNRATQAGPPRYRGECV